MRNIYKTDLNQCVINDPEMANKKFLNKSLKSKKSLDQLPQNERAENSVRRGRNLSKISNFDHKNSHIYTKEAKPEDLEKLGIF